MELFDAGFGGDGGTRFLRDFDATAVGVVFPRMVGADDTIVFDPAEGEGGATVDAEVLHGVGGAVVCAPDDEGFV